MTVAFRMLMELDVRVLLSVKVISIILFCGYDVSVAIVDVHFYYLVEIFFGHRYLFVGFAIGYELSVIAESDCALERFLMVRVGPFIESEDDSFIHRLCLKLILCRCIFSRRNGFP